jgi:hypothetical protein
LGTPCYLSKVLFGARPPKAETLSDEATSLRVSKGLWLFTAARKIFLQTRRLAFGIRKVKTQKPNFQIFLQKK